MNGVELELDLGIVIKSVCTLARHVKSHEAAAYLSDASRLLSDRVAAIYDPDENNNKKGKNHERPSSGPDTRSSQDAGDRRKRGRPRRESAAK
jgi:hypothetical protein